AGLNGSTADNIPATTALIGYPGGVASRDSSDSVYISDQNLFRIRAVSNGVISTAAGTGAYGFGGDGGDATAAAFAFPADVAVDQAGVVYIADRDNNRVRALTPAQGCSIGLSDSDPTYAAPGGIGFVAVNTFSSCSWQVSTAAG